MTTADDAPTPTLAPLAVPAYRRMWGAAVVSHLGTFLQMTAAPWVMLELTGSPLMVSLVTASLALPRLIWVAFLPILSSFGYPPALITSAYVTMYVFYLLVELVWFVAAYLYVTPSTRRRMLSNLIYLPLLPLYRILVFFFRAAGFVYAINEPFSWDIPSPLEQLQAAFKDMQTRARRLWREIAHTR